jgi:hypothetical protein
MARRSVGVVEAWIFSPGSAPRTYLRMGQFERALARPSRPFEVDVMCRFYNARTQLARKKNPRLSAQDDSTDSPPALFSATIRKRDFTGWFTNVAFGIVVQDAVPPIKRRCSDGIIR